MNRVAYLAGTLRELLASCNEGHSCVERRCIREYRPHAGPGAIGTYYQIKGFCRVVIKD